MARTEPAAAPAPAEQHRAEQEEERNAPSSDVMSGDPFSKPTKPPNSDSNELRCTAFWNQVSKFNPSFVASSAAQRLSECKQVDHAAEVCILKASDQKAYDSCNAHILKPHCEKLHAELTARYGTKSWPTEDRDEFIAACQDNIPASTYLCLMDPKETYDTCMLSIMGTKI